MTTIKGFVIYCPHTKGHYAYNTFGLTAYEAWIKHCRSTYDDKDISRKIQSWHDRGYRVKEATLTIYPGGDETEATNGKPSNPNLHMAEK